MTNSVDANQIIEHLNLQPHPEGGYYRETYRSEGKIDLENHQSDYIGVRNFSTCIYFLLTSEEFSAFHRINQDEIWHFYYGSPISLHIISVEGEYQNYIIGNNILKGHSPQYVVNGGNWFAAEVEDENSFALVGCTVSPGFSFEDFEMGNRYQLIKLFPAHQKIITNLTR